MPEEVVFTSGSSPVSGSYSDESIPNIDGRLIGDDIDYLIDTDGNRILIGGGFPEGNNNSTVVWTPDVL